MEVLLGACQEAEHEKEALVKAARELTLHLHLAIQEGQECAQRTRQWLYDAGFARQAL